MTASRLGFERMPGFGDLREFVAVAEQPVGGAAQRSRLFELA